MYLGSEGGLRVAGCGLRVVLHRLWICRLRPNVFFALQLIFNIILDKDRKIRVEVSSAKHYNGAASIKSERRNQLGSMNSNQWGLLIILSLFWGGSFFFVEIALRDFQPFTLVFLRISMAALILVGVVYFSGKRLPTSLQIWMGYFVLGLLNNAIPFTLIVWGQTRIEGGVASILNATTPIFTVLLAHFLTADERLTAPKIVGVLVGFIGVYLMIKPELSDGFSWRGLGQTAVLLAALSYGFAGIFGKRFKNMPATVNSAGMLLCSSAVMLPLAASTSLTVKPVPSIVRLVCSLTV